MATSTVVRPPDRMETLPALAVEDERPSPRRHRLLPRLLSYVLALFLLVNLNFFLPRVLPGDPIEALFSAASPTYVRNDATRAELTAYYGLDGSLAEQHLRYLSSLVQGDLGTSIRQNAPVADLLAARLTWTALLISSGLALSAVVGLVAGVGGSTAACSPPSSCSATCPLTSSPPSPSLSSPLSSHGSRSPVDAPRSWSRRASWCSSATSPSTSCSRQ